MVRYDGKKGIKHIRRTGLIRDRIRHAKVTCQHCEKILFECKCDGEKEIEETICTDCMRIEATV